MQAKDLYSAGISESWYITALENIWGRIKRQYGIEVQLEYVRQSRCVAVKR